MEKTISKMVLKDYTEYSERVAKAYEARPLLEQGMIPSYKALAEHTENVTRDDIRVAHID